MEVDPPSVSRKRRHPESVESGPKKTSSEILELIENPNFEELARWNPIFLKAWNEIRQVQKDTHKTFSACVNQEFTVALTRALLQTHLNLQLPYWDVNHLCPPVPNRFFYVHWIHAFLLKRTSLQKACGVDIGSGASCIYSLLSAQFFGSQMLTTEIDPESANLAASNVKANNLQSKIAVCLVPPSHAQDSTTPQGGPLQRALEEVKSHHPSMNFPLDFVMTNPPFYDPRSMERENRRQGDGRARTSMTVSEGEYPGGELGFISDLIVDSLQNRTSATWFTTMIGKKTSLVQLEKWLTHMLGPSHVEVAEYGPGHYTRWFLAWTFDRPPIIHPTKSRVPIVNDTFQVTLSGSEAQTSPQAAVSEVVDRISSCCGSSPGGWKLTSRTIRTSTSPHPFVELHVLETTPTPITLFVDESESQMVLPERLRHALTNGHNSLFLPQEGHFVLVIQLQATEPGTVMVRLEGHRHSNKGRRAIEKLSTTLAGEITRTNRRWRRIRKRQEDERIQTD